MTQKIKLMLDYGCYPLWWHDSDQIGNIEPATLPLSQATLKRLEALAEANNAQLNWDDPANSPEPTEAELDAWEREGVELWQQLQTELSPDYEVVYFSERQGKILTDISELNREDLVSSSS